MRNINHLLLFFQIKREISTMKLIKHPNVVQLHEVYYFLSDVMMQVSLLPFDDPTVMRAFDRLWRAERRYTWFLNLLMEASYSIRS